ncbi:IS110 family transposase [Ktedonobacter robiniae]|uniref:IS110 family transposase n=1 Tax=Ktedonobacter robiniae TaxID=2778365 RepID=UPI001915CAF6|nr:transposase [Ktedonobacter robiniae]
MSPWISTARIWLPELLMATRTLCWHHAVSALRRSGHGPGEHLFPSDAVVLEASTNAWEMYDRLTPLVTSVTVAHSSTVKLLASARIKTDARDTLKLAQLLAARLVPSVWVPPHNVREIRTLLSHRRRLVSQRTQAFNRLHGLLQRHNLKQPEHQRFLTTVTDDAWWDQLPLTLAETL